MPAKRIRVTEADIKNGWRCFSFACPVARAIVRTLGLTPGRIRVGRRQRGAGWEAACLRKGKAEWSSPLSEAVRRKVERFDRGATIEPFSFILKVPDGENQP